MFMATLMEVSLPPNLPTKSNQFEDSGPNLTICLAVDPDAIPDPNKLLDDLEESLKLSRDAVVVEKGLTMEAAV
ncbi:hypothetical protein GBA52_005952 [Prunus armeniaca]|nr:hypothetical protein GBA52_005952 [Prunus armeniaca]